MKKEKKGKRKRGGGRKGRGKRDMIKRTTSRFKTRVYNLKRSSLLWK